VDRLIESGVPASGTRKSLEV